MQRSSRLSPYLLSQLLALPFCSPLQIRPSHPSPSSASPYITPLTLPPSLLTDQRRGPGCCQPGPAGRLQSRGIGRCRDARQAARRHNHDLQGEGGAVTHMGSYSFPTHGACRLHLVTLNQPSEPEQRLAIVQLSTNCRLKPSNCQLTAIKLPPSGHL